MKKKKQKNQRKRKRKKRRRRRMKKRWMIERENYWILSRLSLMKRVWKGRKEENERENERKIMAMNGIKDNESTSGEERSVNYGMNEG
jgi:hypothetical protein